MEHQHECALRIRAHYSNVTVVLQNVVNKRKPKAEISLFVI
jgi:hypothetical protein